MTFSSSISSDKYTKSTANVSPRSSLKDKLNAEDFQWSDTDEPHQKRRNEILKKYPEIRSLFVYEPLTMVYVVAYVATQVLFCSLVSDSSYAFLLFCAYFVGGFLNHALFLAAHELSHNLCWRSPTANKLTAIFATLPTGFPSAITFGRYHYEHHLNQGHDGVDMDIPTEFEAKYFRSPFMKAVWLFFQPFAYALRPLFIKPKPVSLWEVISWPFAIVFDVLIFQYFGIKGITYLLASTFLGLGLHPAAGHFTAEHFISVEGQETYSYYGILNYLNFNVGYHNEHHDFPRVPWTKLPKVREIAKEYYDSLHSYDSYISVLYQYIMDPNMGPSSRMKRNKIVKTKEVVSEKNYAFAIAGTVALVCGSCFFWFTVIFG